MALPTKFLKSTNDGDSVAFMGPFHGYINLLVQLVLLNSNLNLPWQDLCLLPLCLLFIST